MAKIESKVTVASLGSLVAGVVLAVLTAVQSDPEVISGLPAGAQFVVIAAPHTERTPPR